MSGIKDFKKWPISCKAGVLVILIYSSNIIFSWMFFPRSYSPLKNYLSDLGNYSWNPIGAFFFNFGCIFTSIALIPFYLGFKDWHPEEERNKKLIIIVQVIGLLSAASLAMIGIFSEDFGFSHIFWSGIYFILNLSLLFLGSIILYRYKAPKAEVPFKRGGLIAFFIAILNLSFIVYYALFSAGSLLEWVTVFLSLGFVGLLVYYGRYLSKI
ncbi:MAG: DUF998 domain-containing protein [Promethearchaeota archaeon]